MTVLNRVSGHVKILGFVAVMLAMFASCSFIAGTEEGAQAIDAQRVPLDYIETLMNAASVQGQGFQRVNQASDAATSLKLPAGVFADANRVYVTDLYTGGTVSAPRVIVLDRGAGTFSALPVPVAPADGKLLNPVDVAVSADTVVFVADAQQGRVFGYDRRGTLLLIIGKSGDLIRPVSLALDQVRARLYVADSHARSVRVYSTLGDQLFSIGGTSASGPGGLRTPIGVALDREGRIFVLDQHRRRVHVYDPDGNILQTFPVSDGVPGGPWQPKALAVDSAGHIYVTDSIHNTVLIFDRDGKFRTTWGKMGSQPGDFWSPMGIFIDPRDMIYIADQTNGRVQVYQFRK